MLNRQSQHFQFHCSFHLRLIELLLSSPHLSNQDFCEITLMFLLIMQAFFQRWWRDQSEAVQHTVKKLVSSGQLEFMYNALHFHFYFLFFVFYKLNSFILVGKNLIIALGTTYPP